MVEYATLITEKLGSEGVYGFAGNYKSAASSVARSIDMVNVRSGGNRSGFDYSTGRFDAKLCGFQDSGYFSRAFRRKEKCTPQTL